MSFRKRVVVDTNILFSSLLRRQTRFATVLLKPDHDFFICESILVELFRHKEKILASSALGDDEVVKIYSALIRGLRVEREDLISIEHRDRAMELCREVDPADAPIVALALDLDADLWTGDRRLRRGLEARGFTRFFDPDA